MAMPVAVIAFVVTAAVILVIVAFAVAVVIFVLAVVMAVVVADFTAIFAAMEIPLPTAMTAPVSVLAATGERAMIAETRVVGAIDIAAESDRTVEPRTCSEEDSAGEPCGTVVAERGASV